MKKYVPNLFTRVCIVAVICMTTTVGFGQYVFFGKPEYEIGLNVGPSNFLGDLGGNMGKGTTFLKDNSFKTTKLLFGAYVSAHPSEFIGFTLSLNYTRLEGADSLIHDKGGYEVYRKQRNLSFRSPVIEGLLTTEIYPFVFLEDDDKDLWHKFRPYGVLGIGVFHFNPQTIYTNSSGVSEWVNLKPLRTEGEGMPNYPNRKEYSLTQFNIPYGVGVKYFLSENVSVAFELLSRKTFTDYIDDVSTTFVSDADFDNYFGAGSEMAAMAKQVHNRSALVGPGTRIPGYNEGDKRGTTTHNDSYYSGTIKLGIRLARGEHSSVQTRCPLKF
ncbi:MAG: hypothetical protein C5B52_00640 [Bacteroidetes bacterium]|nr:MAG: hypothetical protein C5B52_00640 [Bacteroidota bacterium]